MTCPCGKGDSLETCCGPALRGETWPETAEGLMRARYSAFATHNVDFIMASHHPDTVDEVDREGVERWSKSAEWLGLEVLATQAGQPGDDEGFVEFVARFKLDGEETAHHERSLFRRHRGRWSFHSGEEPRREPVRHQGPKVGRNDPCPCGSGKKHKKCCGKAA